MTPNELTPEQRERYSRHLILPEIGEQGQAVLLASRVLIVGTGGLGSPAALYLTAAGVGTLGLLDNDTVALSNLQRQVLHSVATLDQPKVISAGARLAALNPETNLELHQTRLTGENADSIVAAYDLAVDCTDNFATRYILNDACVRQRKPMVYGAVSRLQGQLSLFTHAGPCYRCLYPDEPVAEPSGGELGLVGCMPGIVGTLQAMETLKQILNVGRTMVGRLLLVDALEMKFREVPLPVDPRCGHN